jgi:actin-like ATPase involved in cell morphogenesis
MKLPPFVAKLKDMSLSFIDNAEVGVDLGTSTTRVGIFGKGTVLQEPSFVGLNTKSSEFIFFGEEAKEIWGKAPTFIRVIKPVEGSIISDFDSTVALLTRFFQRSVYPFFKSKLFKCLITACKSSIFFPVTLIVSP